MATNNEKLYTEEIVLKMLCLAYQSGFDGPLELKEETCKDILESHTSKRSDAEVISMMTGNKKKVAKFKPATAEEANF